MSIPAGSARSADSAPPRSEARTAEREAPPGRGERAGRPERERFGRELARMLLARRPQDDRGDAAPGLGGPLAHQRAAAAPLAPTSDASGAPATAPIDAAAIAERVLAGVNARGEPTARIELVQGAWAGTQIELTAGPRGVEVTVFAASAAARRAVEAQLRDLARALAERGVSARAVRVELCARDKDARSRQDGRR